MYRIFARGFVSLWHGVYKCVFFFSFIYLFIYRIVETKKKVGIFHPDIPDGRGTAAVRAPLVYSSTSTTGTTGAAHVQLFRCCLTRARVASPRLDLISRPESWVVSHARWRCATAGGSCCQVGKNAARVDHDGHRRTGRSPNAGPICPCQIGRTLAYRWCSGTLCRVMTCPQSRAAAGARSFLPATEVRGRNQEACCFAVGMGSERWCSRV
jgi:hypothetical protein